MRACIWAARRTWYTTKAPSGTSWSAKSSEPSRYTNLGCGADAARALGRNPRSRAATREAVSCMTLYPFQSSRTMPVFSTRACTCAAQLHSCSCGCAPAAGGRALLVVKQAGQSTYSIALTRPAFLCFRPCIPGLTARHDQADAASRSATRTAAETGRSGGLRSARKHTFCRMAPLSGR